MRIAAASVTAAASIVRARSTRRGSKHVYEKNTTENRLKSAAAVLFVVKRYERFEVCHFFRVLVKSYECCALQWCKDI